MRGAHRGVWYSKGTPLMEAELFAATAFAPCTVWPRTVMRGKSRKLTSGPESVPISARRTEPSPRNPRFAAHLRCVSAKEGLGESRGGKGTIWCPCPLLPFAVGTAYPRRRAAAMHSHVMANIPRPGRACLACGGKPPERRNRSPSAEGKNHGAPPDRRKVCPLLTIGILRICKAFYKGFS